MSSGSISPKGMELSSGLPYVLADIPFLNSEPDEDVPPSQSPSARREVILGQEIWVYNGGVM